jgi:hypothetical protein
LFGTQAQIQDINVTLFATIKFVIETRTLLEQCGKAIIGLNTNAGGCKRAANHL